MNPKRKKPTHALFWSLLRQTEGYDEAFKDDIKAGIVAECSGGLTTSLSEMYRLYPAAYSLMIEKLKGDSSRRRERYDNEHDRAAKRVIAAICQCLDRQGYRFEDRRRKLRYAMSIACRAANCGNFDAIPLSRLQAIYNLYCEKNRVGIKGEPLTDAPISKN